MPAEGRKTFLLRIDPKLWSEVEAWAQEELRSANGQIEFLLRQAVLRRRHQRASTPDASAGMPPASGGPPSGTSGADPEGAG